jgi:predicted PurR-regulated permease PerM
MPESGHQTISISLMSWVKLALVGILTYLLFRVGGIVLVLLTAITISTAIDPVISWAKRKGVPRLLSVITLYAAAVLFLSIVFYFIFLPLVDEVRSFIHTLSIYSSAAAEGGILSDLFATQHVFGGIQTPVIMEQISASLTSLSNFLSQGVFSTATSVFGGALSLVLIVVISFYLAVQDDGVGKFLKVIVPLPYERYILGLWRRSHAKIGLWLQGQLILGLMVAILVYIGLTLIGVPNALLFAVLTGLFELIPIFGPILSAIPAIFTAYGEIGATSALIVAILYLAVQQLENHVFYPMVVKKVIGVPPLVSIIALFVGGELAGFLGIVISVPAVIVIMEILDDLEQHKLAGRSQA